MILLIPFAAALIPFAAALILAVLEHGLRWHQRRIVRRLRPWDRVMAEHVRTESRNTR